MKFRLLLIFSFLAHLTAKGQVKADSLSSLNVSDSTLVSIKEIEKDTAVQVPVRVFQPQAYIDYGKLISTALGFDKRLEGAVSFLFFEKYEVITEFGIANLKPEHAYVNGNYASNGNYFRFGGGMVSEINSKSSIGLGLRYGLSKFEDSGRIEIQSASGSQEDFELPFSRNNLSARWWSIVLTSESRIVFKKDEPENKLNYLIKAGFFFRMKFLVTYENDGYPVDVYSIPGYGSAINNQQAAFNLFLKFTL